MQTLRREGLANERLAGRSARHGKGKPGRPSSAAGGQRCSGYRSREQSAGATWTRAAQAPAQRLRTRLRPAPSDRAAARRLRAPIPPWAPRGAPGVCPEHSPDHEGVGGSCTFQSAEAPILGGGSLEHEQLQSPQQAKQIDMFVHRIPRLESTAARTGAWALLVGGDVKRAFLESNLPCVPRALRMLAYADLDIPLLTNHLRKISKIEPICMSLAMLPWYIAHCLSEYGPWASLGPETRGYFYFLLQHVLHFPSYPHRTLLL